MSSTNQSSKKIIYKCDQHSAIISKKFQRFYEEKKFLDTNLIVGSNSVSILAHRVVLCAMSEYFWETFQGNKTPLKDNIPLRSTTLKEIDASALKLIINFMYSGSIELSLETAGGILKAASFLKMKSVIVGCCELIGKNINSSNSLSWFRLAHELSLPKLKANALEFIYLNFKEISKKEELLTLSKNEFKDFLFNNPHGDFEEDVFLAMVAWIDYDKINREHLIFPLLSMIRFQALTPKFIVENRKSVCRTVESSELIYSWLQWHLSPETRPSNDQ